MNPMLNIAIEAIRKAGSFIMKQYEIFNINNIQTIEYKNIFLTKINITSNQLIKNIIKKYYPTHDIITQNTYNNDKINNKTQWIIHPLDNQTNFIKHFPYFTSSILIKIKGKTEITVIYDPIHNDLFSAIKGKGSQLNGYRIHHNNITSKNILHKEAIITCFPYFKQNIIMKILKNTNTKKLIHFRYNGAITLNLAHVATGRIDALFAININNKKLDSGLLLIKEAGGLIFNLNKNNNKTNNHHKNIITGNPKFLKLIIENNHIFKNIFK